MRTTDNKKYFDPSGVGNTRANIFGLPFGLAESKLVFIPVPWDVTVSNHEGTSLAPQMIFDQSSQIDFHDPFSIDAWKQGMAMEQVDESLIETNQLFRSKALACIRFMEEGGDPQQSPSVNQNIAEVNQACAAMIENLTSKCQAYHHAGQIPFLVGGDHSISTASLQALASAKPGFGILQIDAHADLRKDYQGFIYSHASVMRLAADIQGVANIVQVGIRELCDDEVSFIQDHSGKVKCWFDRDLAARQFKGEPWDVLCQEIISDLPDQVYVSFDMDGLDPSFCPHTGTPVPGGLTYNQAMYLLEEVVRSGRQIIGADLVETGPHSFDAMMACRVLYRMAGMLLKKIS